MEKSGDKHQARLLRKTALLVGDIIERHNLKPLWKKQVKKKHVKQLLKTLRLMAEENEIEFVSGRGHRRSSCREISKTEGSP